MDNELYNDKVIKYIYNNHIKISIPKSLLVDTFYSNYVVNQLLIYDEDNSSHIIEGADIVDTDDRLELIIPSGYDNYLKYNVDEVIDKSTKVNIINKDSILDDKDFIRDILSSSIHLRDDQIIAVLRMLIFRSGILQLATGSGKTEVMSAFIKYLSYKLKKNPNVLVLVPTVKLVNQTIERFESYNIHATTYNSTRKVEGVVVSHPSSINNDIKLGVDNLEDLEVLLCDEGHHLSANSWRYVLNKSKNIEYKFALSASIIDQSRVGSQKLSEYSSNERLIIGSTGDLLVNYPTSYYIKNKILAYPVVMRIDNPANEKLTGKTNYRVASKYNGVDYTKIRKCRLESDHRYDLAIESIEPFIDNGRKMLILTETKIQANKLFDKLIEKGLGSSTVMMFGGNLKYKYCITSNSIDRTDDDIMESYSSGRYQILIGTSVLYEGVDVPNLDGVLLFSVGKNPRVLIQSIGRVLRKTKTGRYAYILDFTDHEDKILRRQSLSRRELYLDLIGVDSNLIFDKLTPIMIETYFMSLEGLVKAK